MTEPEIYQCEHDWSRDLYLCPQHNGTTYVYCRSCSVMRLSDDSLEFMNEHNPPKDSSENSSEIGG